MPEIDSSEDTYNGVKIHFVPLVQKFDDISLPNKNSQVNTRKVVRAQFINPNPRNPKAHLKISICHQRKNAKGKFEDCEYLSLSQLKAGQEVRMILDTEQTLALKTILEGLYKYCKEHLHIIDFTPPLFTLEKANEIVKAPPGRKAMIEALVNRNHSQEFWNELQRLKPGEATKFSYARLYGIRSAALNDFELHMRKMDWNESQWQKFFEDNPWIFGYGLSLKWIKPIGSKMEQTTTGASVAGAGKRPDALMKTIAEVSNTAFVDIKKPDTSLLDSKEYRPGVYPAGYEVIGGVSQIQSTIQKWISGLGSAPFSPKDKEGYVENKPIYSLYPKGILVVGFLGQFIKNGKYHEEKISSFELFRRQLINPEIITFDELYQRAAHILSQAQ